MTSIRSHFPILTRTFRDEPLIYLDSAATTQKPQQVIDAIADYYAQHNANVHRAAHIIAAEATAMLEDARESLRNFVKASDKAEIIFTRGTTEAINLVAATIAGGLEKPFSDGDEILITELEHHSNIVPWQLLAARHNLNIVAVKISETGDLDLADFHSKLSSRTRLFCCNHVSNALGTVNPIQELIHDAKQAGAVTLIDGAQAPLHHAIDVQALDCDFYAISGHKMFGPTGIGALYGKLQWLERLPPWQGGGEMIEHVSLTSSTFQKPPYKFEAGTPNIAGAVGLGATIEYLNNLPMTTLIDQEEQLIKGAISRLKQIPGVRLVGEPSKRSAVISFTLDGAHPHDVGTLLDQQGVAVRTGHHCAMPLMERLGIPGTVRASFSLYNDQSDVDRLIQGIEKATTFI
ncbi:MAG: SufS family cysteine desulfurase [Candidatus Azotimanducaceae bacterium]|jgi:SufS family cysteine desulfurase